MDTLITKESNGHITTSVYRKATHTNQYLQFSSHHPLQHKLSVPRTLLHRCDTLVSNARDKKTEMHNIKTALKNCGYPEWTIHKVRQQQKQKQLQKGKEKHPATNKNKGNIGLPYIQGVSEKIKASLHTHNIGSYFRPVNKLREILVHPKDKTKKEDTCGIVYQIGCLNCDYVYIGETGRPFKKRLDEHIKDVANNTKGVRTRSARTSTTDIEFFINQLSQIIWYYMIILPIGTTQK